MSEYNGHPSYEHWNAALWFGNDEGLYRLALDCASPGELEAACDEVGFTATPDGVELTPELIAYVWEELNDE